MQVKRSMTRYVGLMQKQVGFFFNLLILREVVLEITAATHTSPSQSHAAHFVHTPHPPPPSNNPLILFIISQLFLVRTIHERNHSHKHAPMCRAEIQYKYTHFLISSQSSGPFCCFFPRCSVMHRLCSSTSQSHINVQPL